MSDEPMSPMSVIRQVIKAVPAVKWALGVGGILAVVALAYSFRIEPKNAFVSLIAMFIFMGVLVIFARASTLTNRAIAWPAMAFTWFVLAMFMATSLALFTSVFFHIPLELNWLTGPSEKPVAGATPPSRVTFRPPPPEPVVFTAESNWTRQGSDYGTFCNDELRKKSLEHPDLNIVMKEAVRHQRQNGPLSEVQCSCSFEGTPKGTPARSASTPVRPAAERIFGPPTHSHAGNNPADGPDVTSCATTDVANGWQLKPNSGNPETVSVVNGDMAVTAQTYNADSYCVTFHMRRADPGRSAEVVGRATATQQKTCNDLTWDEKVKCEQSQ